MGQKRLSNTMVLHIRKNKTDNPDVVDIANDFGYSSQHRMSLFCRFSCSNKATGASVLKSKAPQTKAYV